MGHIKNYFYRNKNKYGQPLTWEEKKALTAEHDLIDQIEDESPEYLITKVLEIASEADSWSIRLNPDSRTGFDVCLLTSECPLEGLTVPPSTKFLRKISVSDEYYPLIKRAVLREFIDSVSSNPKTLAEIASFFSPAFGFKKQDKFRSAWLNLAKDAVHQELNNGSTFSLQNHRFKPEHFENSNEPIESFIPPIEWFPESLKQVEFGDIFSIVSSKAELEVLKLFFGRVAIGATRFKTHGEDISHDFRTVALVQSSAGCGKSKFVEFLSSAMSKLGLSVEAMQDPSARFNQAPALLANLSVADDSGEKKMVAFTQSPLIKSCATGSPIRVEEKGLDARTIIPNAAILAFLNDIPLKILRSSDSGNADRLALIKADSQNFLRNTDNVSELLQGVTSRIIPVTTNFICNKLGVSTDVLYAYFLRICMDKFLSFYSPDDNAYLVNDYIRKQKQYFKLNTNPEYRQAYFNYLLLADRVLHPESPVDNFNVAVLCRVIQSGSILALSKDDWATEIRTKLAEDFDTCHYGATHWFSGIRDLGDGFHSEMLHRLDDLFGKINKTSNQRKQVRIPDANEAISMLFKGISVTNGTLFEHSASELILFFNDALGDLEVTTDKISEYRSIAEQGIREESKKVREGKISIPEYLCSFVNMALNEDRSSATAKYHTLVYGSPNGSFHD